MAPYGQPALTNIRGTKRQAKKASFYVDAFKKGKHRQVSPKQVCFQKKLIVIRYMGGNALKQFTLKESIVALRGLFPEIHVQASELDVHAEIAGLIAHSGEMAYCARYSLLKPMERICVYLPNQNFLSCLERLLNILLEMAGLCVHAY